MSSAKVNLGKSIQKFGDPAEKLRRKAEAVATGLTLPSGIEFARFSHEGRAYALSARVIVEVETLDARVPDVVIRTGERKAKASARSR